MKTVPIAFVFFVICSWNVNAQKQLVLLRKQDVILRLYPSDEIVLKLKNSRKKRTTYINNLLENAVVAHRDTIPFNQIDRIYFKHPTRLNVIGGLLVVGGAAFLVIDQVNHSLIQGNAFSIDEDFTKATLGGMAVGLPLVLFRKKSEKINYRHRLLIVSTGSAFYKHRNKGFELPYLDH